ncbi:MAG: glycerol-3-phosphate acyltransferase [Chloroflexi bacterium]|nr:glycerol-3-phosphate acyltransferase [Chloroflexota bacterium]MDA1297698.1 glycerol-3-phosphate acyltransferase [Chloroflexota bacterium]
MDATAAVLLITGAYFFGAIPTAYWMGRLIRGIDIREYGSGNVGISNFARHVGKRWTVTVVLFDVAVKGPLPVLLASSKVLDLGLPIEVAAGLAVIAGHNWSVFIRFSGGRGMGTVIGVIGSFSFLLVWLYLLTSFSIWLATWAVTRRRDSAVSWGISVILLPVYSALLDLPIEVTIYSLAFLVITVVKRATSNNPSYWTEVDGFWAAGRLLLIRVLFDRDTLSKEGWVGRSPTNGAPSDEARHAG